MTLAAHRSAVLSCFFQNSSLSVCLPLLSVFIIGTKESVLISEVSCYSGLKVGIWGRKMSPVN